jgi:threonine dehydrogenase-like Zn-dependent dehydrogenase
VAIFGAGPVGLMAAACARLLGAETIYMIDRVDYRLKFAAQTYNIIPINFDHDDDFPSTILQATGGHGVDASIDAVGFEARGSVLDTAMTTIKAEGSSGQALRWCIAVTRRGGVVSIAGVYAGFVHAFMIGDAFDKGLTFAMGQTHVQKYLPRLLQYVEDGALQPDIIISHRMKLADAARGYEMFDDMQDGCRKIVMTP